MVNPVVGQSINFPPKNTPLVEEADAGNPAASPAMTIMWYRTLQALFERTGGGNGIPTYNAATVADAGTDQATATPLVPILNFVTASNKGVRLPAEMSGGEFAIVVNSSPSQPLKVYPAPGCQINSLGTNNPYTMNPGGAIAFPTVQLFWYQTAKQCYATKLG